MQYKINLQTCFNQVKEFQEVFDGIVIPYNNATPFMIRSREGYFQEEVDELVEAIEKNDFIKICDAIADCIYVELGTLIKFGLTLTSTVGTNRLKNLEKKALQYLTPEQFHLVFNEVHRSNMSKICKSLDIAHKTMAQEQFKDVNFNVRYLENNKGIVLTFGVGHPKENKVIKPIDYSPADLRFVLGFKLN